MNENVKIHFRMLNFAIHDLHYYNRLIVHEIDDIIIDDELNDAKLNSTRDIIIKRHSNNNESYYQCINEFNPSYFSLHYPFIFLDKKQDWHTSIPLMIMNLQRNSDLIAHRRADLASNVDNDDDIQVDKNEDDDNDEDRWDIEDSLRVLQMKLYNYQLQHR